MALKRTGQKDDAQAELIRAKDEQLALTLKNADLRIAEASHGSAEANARATKAQESLGLAEQHSAEANAKAEGFRLDIAKANERAASANEIAERERLARLQLEARLADRIISSQQQASLSAALAPFRGVTVDAVTFGDTTEIGRITGNLLNAVQGAGWVVHTAQAGGGERTVTGILIGTRPGSDANIVRAANALASALQSMGIAAGPWPFDQMPLPGIRFNTSVTGDTALRIFIGSKP